MKDRRGDTSGGLEVAEEPCNYGPQNYVVLPLCVIRGIKEVCQKRVKRRKKDKDSY